MVTTRARWIGAVLSLVCAGCAASPTVTGTKSPSGGGTGDGTTASPRLIGSAKIDGAYKASATFSTHPEVLVGTLPQAPAAPDTCADYAKGFAQSPTSFVVPEFTTSGGPTALNLTATLPTGYHGPGVYTSATSPRLGGRVAVGVGDLNGAGFIDTFRSSFPGTTTLTVHPDGSGTLEFSSWGSDATVISGTVQWTCQ